MELAKTGDNIIDSFQGMDSMKGSQIAKCYLSLKVYVGGVIGICVSFIEIAFPAEALSLFGVCMFFVHLEVLSSFSLTRDAFEVFLHLLRSPNLAAVRHSDRSGDRSYITWVFFAQCKRWPSAMKWCFLEMSCHPTKKCPKKDFLKTSLVICLTVLASEKAANKLQRAKLWRAQRK